jgi:hypothetical protein
MSSETATTIRGRFRRRTAREARRERRVLGVQLLGPLTIVAGLVWAVVQPWRIAFLHPHGKTIYDYLVQPPLLVVLVGIVFMVFIAPGLMADLERRNVRSPEG